MRTVTLLILILCSSTVIAQGVNPSGEISRDRLFLIQFEEHSVTFTRAGENELRSIDSLFHKLKFADYEIVLSEVSMPSELKSDQFIGLKRCRGVIDSLVKKYNFPSSIFSIKGNATESAGKYFGVRYSIIDKCKPNQLSPSQEDEYFQKPKKGKKKRN